MNSSQSSAQPKSLNVTLTKSSLLAVVAAMGGYTLFEVLTSGEFDVSEIVTHHLLPTVLIGVIIWLVLNSLLRAKVVSPIREILKHLHDVGNGRLAEMEVQSDTIEINTIAAGVNHLTSKCPGQRGTEQGD